MVAVPDRHAAAATVVGKIAPHHERICELLGVVPVSVICQRLHDEAGLEASVASLRR